MNLGLSLRSTPTRSAARSPVCATPRSEEEDDRLTGEFERKVNLQESHLHSSIQYADAEDMLFDLFCSEDSDSISTVTIGPLIEALESTGLRRSDPRLSEMMLRLEAIQGQEPDLLNVKVSRAEFKELIFDNVILISRAIRKQFLIPDFQNFCANIESIYHQVKKITKGTVADYIPQLARQDPDVFGIAICTVDGQRYSVGDTNFRFTLQSCCKPLLYAIALNEIGSEKVHSFVGQEPSGEKSNAMELDDQDKPHNPMVNAGSIVICSLLQKLTKPEMTAAEKFDYVENYIKRMAGDEVVGFNNSVFLAEKELSDRNYALAHYMKAYKCYPPGVTIKECVDFWYQCCSLEVSCETVGVLAATLAHGGVCPITREAVLKADAVRDVLSLMNSCGFYQYSGQFAFKIGVPGKSSVAGCTMLVIPNTMGIAIYSAALDSNGNSVRGMAFCEELVKSFSFHGYDSLVSNKANPRRVTFESKGDTIVNLMYAAADGDLDNLRRHAFLGHDMAARDFDCRTALHLAAAEGHLECVKFLVRMCGVGLEPRDRWGFTPLSEAERFGHDLVADYLRSALAHERDSETLTAAGGKQLLRIMRKLEIEKKQRENQQDQEH